MSGRDPVTLSAEAGRGKETSKRSAVSQAEGGPYPPSSSERPKSSGTASVGCFLLEERASAGTCVKGQAPVSVLVRSQELCESGGGRPGVPVPNKPCDFCGRKATLNIECPVSRFGPAVRIRLVSRRA